jgi:S-DNA-T family DNA segregation ATPase FtsK/SpoIIIE
MVHNVAYTVCKLLKKQTGDNMQNDFYKLAMAGMVQAGIGSMLASPAITGIGGIVTILSVINGRKLDKFNEIFVACNLKNQKDETPKLVEIHEQKVGKMYRFELPLGLSKSKIMDKKEELENAFKGRIEITQTDDFMVDILVVEKEFFTCDKQAFLEQIPCLNISEYIVGTTQSGELLTSEFGNNHFSTLVCGASGTGKSCWLKSFLLQVVAKQAELAIIDLKGVDYHAFKRYQHLIAYATTTKEAAYTLHNVYEVMQQRYTILKKAECSNYQTYNERSNTPIQPLILLIDEFGVLMDDKAAKSALFDLLSRCRACNISILLATQSPRASVLDGILRCNIKQTIAFKCQSATDSEVALGQKGDYDAFELLTTCGRGILSTGGNRTIMQGYYFTDTEIKDVLHRSHIISLN